MKSTYGDDPSNQKEYLTPNHVVAGQAGQCPGLAGARPAATGLLVVDSWLAPVWVYRLVCSRLKRVRAAL